MARVVSLTTRPPKLQQYGPVLRERMKNGTLFEHQIEALDRVVAWFSSPKTTGKTAVVVMPTGTGKTGVICCLPYVFGDAVEKRKVQQLDLSKPVLVIAPNIAILDQLEANLKPEHSFLLKTKVLQEEDIKETRSDVLYQVHRVGKSADLKALILQGDIILSNAQQWHKRTDPPAWESLPNDHFSVVMVDEAHHLPATQWEGIVRKFREYAKVVFFTATPERYDGKKITTDLAIEEHGFAYELKRDEAVRGRVIRDISFQAIPFNNGDYIAYKASDIGLRLAHASYIIDEIVKLLEKKNRELPLPNDKCHQAMVIAKDIEEAKEIARECQKKTSAETIHSGLSPGEQKAVMDKLKKGTIAIIVTVQMLLEGFDHPPISVAGIATRIESPVKFAQFIGRAQRVVRETKTRKPENELIKADVVTHQYFQQEDIFEKFSHPIIPEDFDDAIRDPIENSDHH